LETEVLEMTVKSWGHSTIAIEAGSSTLVIDPGLFAPPDALENVAGVLITHDHADHVNVGRITELLSERPDVDVWAPEVVVNQFVEAGAPTERVHAVVEGDEVEVAGVGVRVFGRDHAQIHSSIPCSSNVGYLLDGRVFHPGDAFTVPADTGDLDLLLLPVSGPWMSIANAIDYMAELSPGVALPVHDGMLTDPGRMLIDMVMTNIPSSTSYQRLAVGESLAVPHG
jgi:L-ascorbate metabolism protein UlaG (beta-lactamase superfamily)